jgi:hypothetical protein
MRRPGRIPLVLLGLLVAAAIGVTGCADEEPTPPSADGLTVRFATASGDFITVITQEESLERLQGAQPGDVVGVPNGILRPGDGGVNIGHDWHIVDVELADMTMEICDGTADYLDELGYDRFVEEHSDRFCPWSATFVEFVD